MSIWVGWVSRDRARIAIAQSVFDLCLLLKRNALQQWGESNLSTRVGWAWGESNFSIWVGWVSGDGGTDQAYYSGGFRTHDPCCSRAVSYQLDFPVATCLTLMPDSDG